MDEQFATLDLTGVKPTSVATDRVSVEIDPGTMVDDYSDAFVAELRRLNPRRFEQVGLTEEEVRRYCRYLLEQRVACLHEKCKDWKALKNLWIPVFIQYAMRLVGIVEIKGRGLILEPVIQTTSELSLKEVLDISNRIGLFEHDVQIRRDAMPREKMGDKDVMSCALIAGYVRSMSEVEHPVATYIAAFMGFTLQKEQAFEVLYRVQYDDIEYIRWALTNNQVVMGHVGQTLT